MRALSWAAIMCYSPQFQLSQDYFCKVELPYESQHTVSTPLNSLSIKISTKITTDMLASPSKSLLHVEGKKSSKRSQLKYTYKLSETQMQEDNKRALMPLQTSFNVCFFKTVFFAQNVLLMKCQELQDKIRPIPITSKSMNKNTQIDPWFAEPCPQKVPMLPFGVPCKPKLGGPWY